MPKRKKYPRLPNGYGNIRYLGKGRKRPYAVHPPATQTDEHGNYLRPPALCYTDDWYIGFAVLNAYHAGTYNPGDELRFQSEKLGGSDIEGLCKRILTDYSSQQYVKNENAKDQKTFSEVYDEFYRWKYENSEKKLSKQSKDSTRAAYKNCSILHDKIFQDLRLKDLQECVDNCKLKKSSLELIISLLKQMFRYASLHDICDRNYSEGIRMPDAEEDEHGVPFTDDELLTLWQNKSDPVIEMILIMCYSGFRISAYKTMKVDMHDWYFQGGVKTAAGKDRTVPIHTAIRPLVFARIKRIGCMMDISPSEFRKRMYEALEAAGMERHTPHDCRHTFSRICEKYGVAENDRKRMLGHSFGSDITNGVYGHRTLEELREEIEKIKLPIL